MREDYMAALVKATKARLTASLESWGTRVYKAAPLPSEGRAVQFPYIVCTFAGGGRNPSHKTDFIEVLWQIRVVGTDPAQAYAARARIRELFNQADITQANALDGGTDWEISTWQERGGLDLEERIDSHTLYHVGIVYRVVMQEK